MNALKSVFNFLGRFLTSTRIVVTNLITFIFLALVFIGLISVFIPNNRSIDKEGKVVILNPEGVLVDQEVQYSDFQFSFGQKKIGSLNTAPLDPPGHLQGSK